MRKTKVRGVSLWSAALALAAGTSTSLPAASPSARAVTIEDCIEVERVVQTYQPNDASVIFSRNGTRWVTTLWQGNLQRNVNEYRLLLFETENPARAPTELVKLDFTYEQADQHSRPLSQLSFVSEDRLAALATFGGAPRQVIAIDLNTRSVKQLTRQPEGVLAFSAAADTARMVYAVRKTAPNSLRAELSREGYSLEDRELVSGSLGEALFTGRMFDGKSRLQFFMTDRDGVNPRLIHEGANGIPGVQVSPDGRYAILYPYETGADRRQSFGLADLSTGAVGPLFSAVGPVAGPTAADRILWSPDSSNVLIYDAPELFEIDPVHKRVQRSSLGEMSKRHARYMWTLLGWSDNGAGLLFSRWLFDDDKQSLLELRRNSNTWSTASLLSRSEARFELNPRYIAGTNGRQIVGVKDGMADWPQLAVYDRAAKTTRVVSDLNRRFRHLRLGEVSLLNWGDSSFGFLIKPVDYVAGRRYPLIVQFKDEGGHYRDTSFILDGTEQYSGAAIQVWANAGFVVLFTPGPFYPEDLRETPQEDARVTAHIESGIDYLESLGIALDRDRIGITGWSRAGWWTQAVVARAKFRFAAASSIDNVEYNLLQYVLSGGAEYFGRHWGGNLPWGKTGEQWWQDSIDRQYSRIRTPWLIESHGQEDVARRLELYMALKTAGVPVDHYVFPDAPHNLRSPRHRQISLSMQTDWFRYWLQDYRDPAMNKRPQYERWSKMRLLNAEAARRRQTAFPPLPHLSLSVHGRRGGD